MRQRTMLSLFELRGRARTMSYGVLAIAALWAAQSVSAAAQLAPSPQDVDDGRQIYEDFCATCHGRDMVTAGTVTFDLRKFPKDDFQRFQHSVLNGKPPGMPAWGDRVSRDELNLLWAYVRGGP